MTYNLSIGMLNLT